MAEAVRSIEVEVCPEKFFQVITDFERYPEFLQAVGLRAIQVLSRAEREVVVEHEVKLMGKGVKYTLRYALEPASRLGWSLVTGNLMSVNDGSWTLEPLEGGRRTRATYRLVMKVGVLVPAAIVTALAATQLPAMLDAFKRRAEALA
ncbi:MAG TPA: SRPBCC family protein [Myxococcota bacterium]|nr:SRPBCC family protein [Myxococcota bacterium]HRY94138.1 SRPBCC family protein [Myxococcota bacterium]HSA24278.1 SRPBCC family protein [Myxococcota bacterium]